MKPPILHTKVATWWPPWSPAPGPRKASLDQVPHYFLSQKTHSPDPRVGGFRGPAATCADPGKGIAHQFLSLQNQTSPKSKTKLKLPIGKPQAHSRDSNSDRSLVPPVCTDGFRGLDMFFPQEADLPILTWALTTVRKSDNGKSLIGKRTLLVKVSTPMRAHVLRRKPDS